MKKVLDFSFVSKKSEEYISRRVKDLRKKLFFNFERRLLCLKSQTKQQSNNLTKNSVIKESRKEFATE